MVAQSTSPWCVPPSSRFHLPRQCRTQGGALLIALCKAPVPRFQRLARSCAPSLAPERKLTLAASSSCALFCKNTRGRGVSHKVLLEPLVTDASPTAHRLRPTPAERFPRPELTDPAGKNNARLSPNVILSVRSLTSDANQGTRGFRAGMRRKMSTAPIQNGVIPRAAGRGICLSSRLKKSLNAVADR